MHAHPGHMQSMTWVEFDLSVAGITETLRVRVRESPERSVALVQLGSAQHSGLGATAREALAAALAPLGSREASAVMAAPAMFGASVEVLTARSAG